MFLLELIYFLAMKKEEVTWKFGADFSPCHSWQVEGEGAGGRGCTKPRAGHDSVFRLQMVKGKYQLEPTLRCWVPPLHTKKKIHLQWLIMWPLVEMNYQFATSCVWREANCALLRQESGT